MIKEVTEIPKPDCKQKGDKPKGYYQELIYNDLAEAFKNKIPMFEIIGYDTKPDYILQSARNVAYNVTKDLVFKPANTYAKRILKKELASEYIKSYTPQKYSPIKIFTFYGVTLKDGVKHIFCTIDFNEAKKYKQVILEKARELTITYLE